MTPREKLADWISGGAITHMREHIRLLEKNQDRQRDGRGRLIEVRTRLNDALRTILAISQDGKGWSRERMAEVAAQALGQEGMK